ncbi:GspH/FimT family pseudopilin [Methyloprofundus sp.]|uniref:GspH/FimT family pseudopilin n=1 Tax=Methyloprofundus sp. TaxID=2020875 RepID=UPI003D09AC49
MNKKYGLAFTLTELMITVAIAGILASIAAPSFIEMIQRYRLKTVAEAIHASLQYAKMQSVKENKSVELSFKRTSNTVWCYGITDEAIACDCIADAAACTITENGTAIQKVISSTHFSNVQLAAEPANAFSFNPIRATVTSNGVTINNGPYTIRIKTSGFGKVSYCVPIGESLWGGYKQCLP